MRGNMVADVAPAVGESIRLFLVAGRADGLITAELINWTGHTLVGGIDDLPALLARPEAVRPGVYFLLGDDGDPTTPKLYIGETENIRERLIQHERTDKKAFVERVCVITSKDANLTKAHIRYLESKLIASAEKVGRAKLDNGTRPPPPPLPEADQSDMEKFLRHLSILLPVLGFDFFWTPRGETPPSAGQPAAAAPELFLGPDPATALARATYIDGRVTILAGSHARANAPQSVNHYRGQREAHIAAGRLQLQADQTYVFTTDIEFASPSAAAAVALDRNSNGRIEWRVKGTGQTLQAWQTAQLPVSTEE